MQKKSGIGKFGGQHAQNGQPAGQPTVILVQHANIAAPGLGNALVLPHVLELLKGSAATKLSEIAVYTGLGDKSEGEDALAQKVIDKVWALNAAIGIPKTTDVIKEQDIEELVDLALKEGSGYPTPRFHRARRRLFPLP